ncbi:DNA polymerase III subunit beta [Patescibacteria group bacterium]|nr:DNA polymerase III subunit beta [Patescibacteria group bacterium]
MKFTCTQENFYRGLSQVVHVASKSATLPILNNVLIRAEDGSINLNATNLEIGIKTNLRGKIEQGGEFTVQAKLLFDYISLLPKEKIEIEIIEQTLHIVCQNFKTSIKGLSTADFPVIPEITKEKAVKIKANNLKQALAQVVLAVTLDESRPEISGVLMDFSGNILTLVGTDSYRLAEKKIKIDSELNGGIKVIVPLKTMQEVFRILDDEGDKEVTIYINNSQILFQLNSEVDLISRLIEGNYPDYGQIIPADNKTLASFEVDEMIKMVKSVSLFCKPGINDIKIVLIPDKKELVVTAANSSIGENLVKLEAEIKGNENEVVFNYRYLLDGLNNLNAKNGILGLNSESAPGVIKPEGDESYLYIIMPIRQ